jgi:hypothetical protein
MNPDGPFASWHRCPVFGGIADLTFGEPGNGHVRSVLAGKRRPAEQDITVGDGIVQQLSVGAELGGGPRRR